MSSVFNLKEKSLVNLLYPKDLNSIKLKVVNSNGKCHYHPAAGQEINLKESLPKGMCPYIYVAAYPYALSLLYDAEFSWRKKADKDSVIAQCLRPKNQMVFMVKRIANPNIDKERLKKFEEERYKIFIKLLEKNGVGNDCSDCLGYENMIVGKEFEFNRGDLPEICPAAFNQMFPYLIEFIYSKESSGVAQYACPDPKTNIIFEMSKL